MTEWWTKSESNDQEWEWGVGKGKVVENQVYIPQEGDVHWQ